MCCRYQITERQTADRPTPSLRASALPRASGVFDLWDEDRSQIVCTSPDLRALRRYQAQLNSSEVLDRCHI